MYHKLSCFNIIIYVYNMYNTVQTYYVYLNFFLAESINEVNSNMDFHQSIIIAAYTTQCLSVHPCVLQLDKRLGKGLAQEHNTMSPARG